MSENIVYRFDRAELKPPKMANDGSLLLEGVIAKPGILTYQKADGSTCRELITEEELYKPSSLQTLLRKCVTLEHPSENIGPGNYSTYSVGDIDSNVRTDDGLVVSLAVRRADAIAAIMNGVKGLSPGYRCKLSGKGGVHPVYGEYDDEQLDRDYNHIAVTDSPRGGSEVAMRLDAATQIIKDNPTQPKQEVTMDEELKKMLEAMMARIEALEQAKAPAEVKADEVTELPKEEVKMDSLLTFYDERRKIEDFATEYNIEFDRNDSNHSIKKAIVKALRPELVAGKSEAFIEASFELMCATPNVGAKKETTVVLKNDSADNTISNSAKYLKSLQA